MIGWLPGRQQKGKPASADLINDTAQNTAAHSRINVGAGLAQSSLFGTPIIRALAAVLGIAPAKSPGGGIAARSGSTVSSGTCTLYTWDGTSFALGSQTITVRNWYTNSISANTLVIVVKWANSYWVLTQDCA